MSGSQLVVLRSPVPVPDGDAFGLTQPRTDFELIRRLTGGAYADCTTLAPGLYKQIAGKDESTAAAFAAWKARGETGSIFTTGEEIAFRLLPLLRLAGWKGRLFSVIHASHSWKWRRAAGLLGAAGVGMYYTVASLQRDALVRGAGLPGAKVKFIYDSVDAAFFDPALASARSEGGYVFACGLENRDYDTLAAAAASVSFKVRVQASGYFPKEDAADAGLPANLEINRTRLSYDDLRARYAGARFAVVPLHAVPYAAGVNGLLEAMAMGKAAIVTDSPGLADYTGLDSLVKVPAADPARLAAAMEALWRDPDACAEMGRANRDWVLRHATVDQYAGEIASAMLNG